MKSIGNWRFVGPRDAAFASGEPVNTSGESARAMRREREKENRTRQYDKTDSYAGKKSSHKFAIWLKKRTRYVKTLFI